MRTCKVKPLRSHCNECIERQMMYEKEENCSECIARRSRKGELLQVCLGAFDRAYGIVVINGHISKIPLERIFDVKMEGENESNCG